MSISCLTGLMPTSLRSGSSHSTAERCAMSIPTLSFVSVNMGSCEMAPGVSLTPIHLQQQAQIDKVLRGPLREIVGIVARVRHLL